MADAITDLRSHAEGAHRPARPASLSPVLRARCADLAGDAARHVAWMGATATVADHCLVSALRDLAGGDLAAAADALRQAAEWPR